MAASAQQTGTPFLPLVGPTHSSIGACSAAGPSLFQIAGWSSPVWLTFNTRRTRDENGNSSCGPVELFDRHRVLVESDRPSLSAMRLHEATVIVDGDGVMIITAEAAPGAGKRRHHVPLALCCLKLGATEAIE